MTKHPKIEGFAPNCLMGVTGAISTYKGYTENINKLYFHSSFVYKKMEGSIYQKEKNCMNVEFSRELPLSKEQFMERLRKYYSLEYFFNEYTEFNDFIEEVEAYTRKEGPIMAEIDFFFMRKYSHYQKVHSQHMMIFEGIDREKKVFHVCEAVFGCFDMPFDEYRAYFQEVIQNRKRKVYLLRVKRLNFNRIQKVNKEFFIEDIDRTYRNLSQDSIPNVGMNALKEFKKDFLYVLEEEKCESNIVIPGMWVFMCDHMNNVNFIQEWKMDYKDFDSESLENIRKISIMLNRKWFYISTTLKDIKVNTAKDIKNVFLSIEELEYDLMHSLEILKTELESYEK